MLAFISFLRKKTWWKQYISDKKIEWKEAKYELLHNTSCFLKVNLWRLTVHLWRGILCTAHAQQAFLSILIVCIPWLLCHLGTRKVSIFSSFLLALSCGVDNFFREGLYIVTIFTLKSNLRQKSRNPLDPLQYCQYSLAPYLNVILIHVVAGISTPNFALVWKTTQFLPFASLL